jgi:membrane-associated protease RseP (regulator of RpoE activity)
MWAWVSENYPLLRERAQAQIDYWNGQMQSHPKPGFIGIIGITQDYKLKPGLEPFKDFLDFFEGLLFFLFIINIGVAIVNLLPLKPLDGGRMWDAVLKRYLPKKQAERIIRCVGYFTLLMLLLNFIPFGALF